MITLTLPWPPTVNSCAGVYRIEDIESKCFYIGSAVDFKQRFNHHIYCLQRGKHSNHRLQRVWNIDPNRLSFSIVKAMPGAERTERLFVEQQFLDAAGVGKNKSCFNMLAIAGSHQGARRSEESKKRLSVSQKGRTFSDEAKAKMRAAKLGKPLSQQHRMKISMAGKGRPGPAQTKDAILKFRKYKDEQVIELRRLFADGSTLIAAACKSGITRTTARRIVNGESYKEIK